MSKQNTLANAISKIRNAQSVKKQYVIIEGSLLILSILKKIKQLGYIEEILTIKKEKKLKIKIKLKYEGKLYHSVIKEISMISKPSRKVFLPYRKIRKFYEGLGVKIISTSKGIVTDHYAIKNKIGGEIICNII